MKRLKRALSLTKSTPRIEESISEIDEYHINHRDSQLDVHNEEETPSPLYNGNIDTRNNFHIGSGNNNRTERTTENGKLLSVCVW